MFVVRLCAASCHTYGTSVKAGSELNYSLGRVDTPMLPGCPSGGHPMPHVTAAACGSALKPCRSRHHGLLVGQCLTELLVYMLNNMLVLLTTSCAVGFEGRN